MFVMDRSEDFCSDFVYFKEMMKVSAGMIFATFAVTTFNHRREIVAETSVFDVDATVGSVKRAVAGETGRADAVERIATKLGAKK